MMKIEVSWKFPIFHFLFYFLFLQLNFWFGTLDAPVRSKALFSISLTAVVRPKINPQLSGKLVSILVFEKLVGNSCFGTRSMQL